MDAIINVLEVERIPFKETKDGIEIDCGGNPTLFMKAVETIHFSIESWTYYQELGITIKIDTAFEKVIIENPIPGGLVV